jgi:DNA mismatch repair protein MutS
MKSKPKYSPMMEQYLKIKKQHPDTLIFFRLGDFYELFFDDAKIASKELELVLTGKSAGVKERVPMCGVPYHAVNNYLEKLIKRGYKIGIVEQTEDPKTAKKLVKREVVQIITPGTLVDVGLDDKQNNYILCIEKHSAFYILAFCDLSTGELGVLNIENNQERLLNEIDTFETKEIVVAEDFDTSVLDNGRNKFLISRHNDVVATLEHEHIVSELKDVRQISCIVRLVDYLATTQKRNIDYLQKARIIKTNQQLKMDVYTRNNLELIKTIRNDDRYGSLLWVLDKTKTAMGARLLKSYLYRPLADAKEIEERLDIVEALSKDFLVRKELSGLLAEIYDLPRLIGRIGYGNANAKDLVQLSRSLKVIPNIKSLLNKSATACLVNLSQKLEKLDAVVSLINKSIVDNPPFVIREGGMIRRGYDKELDQLYILSKGGKQWISDLEAKEKEKTGIKGLKIGYNKVFGFYIEISNSFLPQVKDEFGYIRKQTLTTGERYITQELKEKEDLILNAEDKIVKLEYEIFQSIRNEVKKYTGRIQSLADVLSIIDVLCSFAEVAVLNGYTRPRINDNQKLVIKEGRHPVLEKVSQEAYVPNDLEMDADNFLHLITGPNMGGKSTYMRQVALAIIMAQIGSFVAAKEMDTPVFDQIFTRIGASDDLVSGQSTFMVEMLEVNNALRNASSRSLIVFDEIGRGTSTFDGMALAQAIIEYLCTQVKAMTLFSTHYHELTNLEGRLKGLENYHVTVFEENEKVTFLYRVEKGSANKSYGINVARLAHLPQKLLDRARDILSYLEKNKVLTTPGDYIIKEVVKESAVEQKIKEVDPLAISPLEALNLLYEMKKKLKQEDK